MERRKLLKLFGVTVLGTTVANAVMASRWPALASDDVRWGYVGEAGPEHWGSLTPEFQACQMGAHQTPIDLREPIEAKLGAIAIDYKETPLKIINNGHTIQVNYESGSSITVGDETYNLLQFHFHHPSEHLVMGQPFEMELHLVHRSTTGRLAVVGVLLKEGTDNSVLQPLWAALPNQQGQEHTVSGATINAARLLPADPTYYEYYGSLTTPPCSEGVLWLVMQQPVEISAAQIESFKSIFPHNARPIQPLNERLLLESP